VENVGALGGGHLRECKLEVAQAYAAKAPEKGVSDDRDTDSSGTGHAAGKDAKAVDKEPGRTEFEDVAESAPGRRLMG
jgi:hypothetical protein